MLSTTNGDKRVDSLDTSVHWLLDELPGDDTGGLESNPELLLGSKGTTNPTLSGSKLRAILLSPELNSTISSA